MSKLSDEYMKVHYTSLSIFVVLVYSINNVRKNWQKNLLHMLLADFLSMFEMEHCTYYLTSFETDDLKKINYVLLLPTAKTLNRKSMRTINFRNKLSELKDLWYAQWTCLSCRKEIIWRLKENINPTDQLSAIFFKEVKVLIFAPPKKSDAVGNKVKQNCARSEKKNTLDSLAFPGIQWSKPTAFRG